MHFEFTRNSLPEKARMGAVALLNRQLADALDLGLQAKQAHWNVKGPSFFPLHALFDVVAGAVEEASDLIAERAVQLGGIAEGTSQVIVRDSRLPVYEIDLYRESDHVRALARSLSLFARSTRDAVQAAVALGDAATADVFTQISRTADALLWKVSSHIAEAWDRGPREVIVIESRPAGRV